MFNLSLASNNSSEITLLHDAPIDQEHKQDNVHVYNVTLRRVRATIVTVNNQ